MSLRLLLLLLARSNNFLTCGGDNRFVDTTDVSEADVMMLVGVMMVMYMGHHTLFT